MGQVKRREQCPTCLDSGHDNLVVYQDDSTYCFKCKKANGVSKNNMVEKQVISKPPSSLVETGVFVELPARGISKEVCEAFNYQVGNYTGYVGNDHVRDEQVHIANYCDEYGTVVAQKIRASKKRMTIRGEASKMTLYGQWRYQPNDKVFITVVEGEIDALSVAEAQGANFPVVSIPNGAASAKKALQDNLEFLQGFKHVVLGFDNDETGQDAVKECIELFEPGRVRVAKWDLKDPNDLLVSGRAKEIKEALFNAKEVRPDKICTPADLLPRVLERPTMGTPWPWKDLSDVTLGCREKQLIVIGAGTGVGKTELVKDIILHMVTQTETKCGMFSFEQDAADTIRRLIGGMLNVPLHLPGTWWDEKEIRAKAEELNDKLFIYDNWGGAKVEEIIPKMRYLAKAHGVKLFVVDHLTALAAKMDGDERRGIDKAMELLASLTRELKCCILLVSHLARDKKTGDKEDSWGSGRKPTLENFRGSSAIEAWSDDVIGLSRNCDSEDSTEKRLLRIECLKARLNGTKRGFNFMLIYNDATGRLEDVSL
jgi:twinkle protein